MNVNKTIALFLLSLTLLCFFACSDTPELSVDEVTAQIESSLDGYDFVDANERYLRANVDYQRELAVRFAAKRCESGAACEFGVFECRDKEMAKELAEHIEARIEKRLELADNRYFSDESSNLSNARVKQNGRYLFYCVLPPDDGKNALDIFESNL